MNLAPQKFVAIAIVSLAPASALAQSSLGAPQGYEDYRAKSIPRLNLIIRCFSHARDERELGSCMSDLQKPSGMSFSEFKDTLIETATINRDCYLSSATREAFVSCRTKRQQVLVKQSLSQNSAKPPIRPVASANSATPSSAVNIVAKAICIYTTDKWKTSPPASSSMPENRMFRNILLGSISLFKVSNQPEKNGGSISSEFGKSWLAANNGNEGLAKKNLNAYYAWNSDAHISDYDSKWQFNEERGAALRQAVFKACPAPLG